MKIEFYSTKGHSFVSCSLCEAVVCEADKEAHKEWHENQIAIHESLMNEAKRYVSPPRYG